MKILILNTLFGGASYGGAEKSVGSLAHGLVIRGHVVTIISLVSSKAQVVNPVVKQDGLESRHIKLWNMYWPFRDDSNRNALAKIIWHTVDSCNPLMSKAVRNCLNGESYDVVLTNNLAGFSAAVWGLFADLKIPIVHIIRDYYLLCSRSAMFRHSANCTDLCSACRLFSYYRRHATSQVSAVIGISKFVLSEHRRFGLFPSSQYHVVGNPVYAPAGYLRPDRSSEALAIGFIGRIVPEKGLDLIIEAVRRADSLISLYIAGDGPPDYVARLQQLGEGLAIKWMGRVAPVVLFDQVDILVMPSIWREPFGRVIIEAFGHGVPCLVHAAGGGAELIDEQTGWLASNVEEFSERLSWCRDNVSLVRNMASACLGRAEDYQPEVIAKKIEDIISEVIQSY